MGTGKNRAGTGRGWCAPAQGSPWQRCDPPDSAAHTQISLAQVPFWNGCNEDERCVPNLVLDARSDLPTAM